MSEWNDLVKSTFAKNKGTMVNGKPYALKDAMREASRLRKAGAKTSGKKTKSVRPCRKTRRNKE
uniref:Uncharacterized protein n=1 Tax=viral metagenome TaxID=1070528 RepID=A0A6C0I3K9_9ZZZZ